VGTTPPEPGLLGTWDAHLRVAISDNECLVLVSVVVIGRRLDAGDERSTVKIRIGIDIACRAAHQAACADETGRILWSGYRFRTIPTDLKRLWAKVPDNQKKSWW
jgi:hypothetical protein